MTWKKLCLKNLSKIDYFLHLYAEVSYNWWVTKQIYSAEIVKLLHETEFIKTRYHELSPQKYIIYLRKSSFLTFMTLEIGVLTFILLEHYVVPWFKNLMYLYFYVNRLKDKFSTSMNLFCLHQINLYSEWYVSINLLEKAFNLHKNEIPSRNIFVTC